MEGGRCACVHGEWIDAEGVGSTAGATPHRARDAQEAQRQPMAGGSVVRRCLDPGRGHTATRPRPPPRDSVKKRKHTAGVAQCGQTDDTQNSVQRGQNLSELETFYDDDVTQLTLVSGDFLTCIRTSPLE